MIAKMCFIFLTGVQPILVNVSSISFSTQEGCRAYPYNYRVQVTPATYVCVSESPRQIYDLIQKECK